MMSNYLKYYWILIVMIATGGGLMAQSSDIFRLEYTNIPNANSKSAVDRYRVLVQLPLKIDEHNYILVAGDYRYLTLELENDNFTTSDLESVQTIEASLGFLHKVKESPWYYGIKSGVRLASNFESKLSADDYLYIVGAYAILDRTDEELYDKPNRLIVGLEYTTTPGRNYPLPILNYYREFHPDWTYTLGVPKTNVRYKFDKKNHVQAFVTLDNFHVNIQGNKVINGRTAENISQTLVLGGLGYEHYFTEHLLYFGYIAYSIYNDYRFRDNERQKIYSIDDANTLYFKTGLKFKF